MLKEFKDDKLETNIFHKNIIFMLMALGHV